MILSSCKGSYFDPCSRFTSASLLLIRSILTYFIRSPTFTTPLISCPNNFSIECSFSIQDFPTLRYSWRAHRFSKFCTSLNKLVHFYPAPHTLLPSRFQIPFLYSDARVYSPSHFPCSRVWIATPDSISRQFTKRLSLRMIFSIFLLPFTPTKSPNRLFPAVPISFFPASSFRILNFGLNFWIHPHSRGLIFAQ